MNKIRTMISLMIAFFVVFSGYWLASGSLGQKIFICVNRVYDKANDANKKVVDNKSAKMLTIDEQIEALVNKMSDGQKIGQLMMIGIKGNYVNDDVRYMLSEYNIGGIILFDRNMETNAQVQKLVADIQKNAKKNTGLALFVAVDEEGGQIVRMPQHLTVAPAAEKLGQEGDEQAVAFYAHQTAIELKSLGININFAPDADLGLGKGRSYGKDPVKVAKFVRAAGEAYQAEHILFSLKHFPGIGKSTMDSHFHLSKIMVSRAELESEDMLPFYATISSLDNNNFFVMISHFQYPVFDAENPASLSPVIMQTILRQQLGFSGLIITDDMEMGAVAKLYPFAELGVRAVMAGADIVLVCHEYEHQIDVYNGMLQALRDGRLQRQRVDESVRRILKVKLTMMENIQ